MKAVTQTGSLLCRGLAARSRGGFFVKPIHERAPADCQSAKQQTTSLRYDARRPTSEFGLCISFASCASCACGKEISAASFPQAERAEDGVEQIFRGGLAHDFTDGVRGNPQIKRDEF